MSFGDTSEYFFAFDTWMRWQAANRWIFDRDVIRQMIAGIAKNGLRDPVYGAIPPSEIEISGTNYRETISARGLNSRTRALMSVAVDLAGPENRDFDVYAPEYTTPFADRMREHFPKFVGSEYFENAEQLAQYQKQHPDCAHQDVLALTYPDNSFDLYISSEVIEHVPSVPKTLSEAQRILRPGGYLIATFPFSYVHEQSHHKARLTKDGIEYLTDPEYHGNPMSDKGSLVFSIPGWDILETSKAAGFSDRAIKFVSSTSRGSMGAEVAGVFILVARA